MDKIIRLTKAIGSAKKGTVFIRGLHGVPDSTDYWESHSGDEFYWEKGNRKSENNFLFYKWLKEEDFNSIN